jgi:hypothetical protein
MTTSFLKAMSVALFAGLLIQKTAMCADIVVDKSSNHELVSISLTGEIKRGDDLVFARLAKSAKEISLSLESSGGDVDTAMAIGSIIRKSEGWVMTRACYSACVLIFAGGVTRTGPAIVDEPVVGVHRIFFAELQPGLTASQVKARYDAQLNRVRSYLAEMNVAPELLSFMQSIEPGDMHVLTQKELNLYGLRTQDAIYAERLVAARSEELGISSLEYRTREQRGNDECKDVAATMKEPTEAERAMATNWGISVDIYRQRSSQVECAMAIHYGTSVDIYRQRSSQVNERCRRYTDYKQNRCQMHFMTTGRATP